MKTLLLAAMYALLCTPAFAQPGLSITGDPNVGHTLSLNDGRCAPQVDIAACQAGHIYSYDLHASGKMDAIMIEERNQTEPAVSLCKTKGDDEAKAEPLPLMPIAPNVFFIPADGVPQ